MGYVSDSIDEGVKNEYAGSEWGNDYKTIIIDGYSQRTHTAYAGDGIDMRIVFRHDGEDYLTTNAYRNLSIFAIDRVRKLLDKLIEHNKLCIKVGDIYHANGFMTIMHKVDELIENEIIDINANEINDW